MVLRTLNTKRCKRYGVWQKLHDYSLISNTPMKNNVLVESAELAKIEVKIGSTESEPTEQKNQKL